MEATGNETPKSEDETTTPKSDASEPEFDAPGMPFIEDKAYQTRVKNYQKLARAEQAGFEAYEYLRVRESCERIKLTALANEFWAAAKEKEAAKADK